MTSCLPQVAKLPELKTQNVGINQKQKSKSSLEHEEWIKKNRPEYMAFDFNYQAAKKKKEEGSKLTEYYTKIKFDKIDVELFVEKRYAKNVTKNEQKGIDIILSNLRHQNINVFSIETGELLN